MFGSLKRRGRMAIVLDTGAVTRGSGTQGANREREIRKSFVEADVIEALIELPENMFYNTPAPGIVMVLNRAKDHPREVLLVKASKLFHKGRPKNEMLDEHITSVHELFRSWQRNDATSTVVTLAELRAGDYDLLPSRYAMATHPENQLPLEEAIRVLRESDVGCAKADAALWKALAGPNGRRPTRKAGTKGSRKRKHPVGAGTVRLESLIERPQYGYTATASTVPGIRFLRITDLRDDGVDWETVPGCDPPPPTGHRYGLRDGDLVIARIGATTGKAWLVRNPPPAVFASYLIRIRARSDCDPRFLAAFFRSEGYWSQIAAAKGGRLKGGINIGNLNALQIPRLTPDSQRQLGDRMDAIAAATEALRRKRDALDDVFQSALAEFLVEQG